MIILDNITIRTGTFVLTNVNLHIPTGSYAVLMGRTGCGKTTVMEAICGLRHIESGRIRLMGRDVTDEPPGKRGVGLVPQDAALFSTMTVEDHLGFALQVRRRPRKEIASRTAELAESLSIQDILHRFPQGLSGGERQRVAIGRALAAHPDILCLDEPFSALDEETHGGMLELLRRVHRETGVTVLHITHNRTEAEALAQNLIVLRDGRFYESNL
jgi:ABC-type sugar transport system ATPase subunit